MVAKLSLGALAMGDKWFRGMTREDLPDVLKIEVQAFGSPWSEEDFVEHLEEPETVALVVECDAGICGYLLAADLPGRRITEFECSRRPRHDLLEVSRKNSRTSL